MNTSSIITAILIALAFGTWPIIAKYSGASLAYTTVIIYGGGLLSTLILASKHLTKEPFCTTKAIIIVGLCSLINGVAVWFYTTKSIDKGINTSLFMVMVSLAGIIVSPVFNQLLNHETLTNKQWLGIVLAIVVVWLMKK
jgi:drug/metabolite transporter (DMT)-like permease